MIERLSPKSEQRRIYLKQKALRDGIPFEDDENIYKETEPDFYLRRYLDE